MMTKSLIAAISMLTLTSGALAAASFDQVWGQVSSDPYDGLPAHEVTFSSIGGFLGGRARAAATATLSNDDDLRPPYVKVVHPNGVCLAGHWRISADSPFTGAFARGTDNLIVVRASTATGTTQRGSRRAFGFAGKLFPTTDSGAAQRTGNFFTVDDLGGLDTDHYLDTMLTNQPATSTPPLADIGIAYIILRAFEAADSNATKRQVYPLSELGMSDPSGARTPHWMAIRASAGQERSEEVDFRDELQADLRLNGGLLRFDILVAGRDDASWTQLGTIDLDRSVASFSCDQSLHFPHPVWRTDLIEP